MEWVATGEDVLAPSLGLGSFTRDENDTVQEADLLYRPWLGVPRRNEPVAMFFRDRVISDLVGFQYSGTPADEAAADFMGRLQAIKDRLAAEGATGPHVVSVILDGENAWENYPNDGIDFLRALYGALNEADWVRTVTPSQYLEAFGDRVEALDEVWPGAWFSSNYATWIGEPEEATAWDYLWEVRDDLSRFERSGDVNPEALAAAYEKMLFAEGSDWFWWYGADQSSGNDDYFDTAFRELLGQVYDALGQERPAFVSVPIIPETPVLPDQGRRRGAPRGDHRRAVPRDEWATAAAYLDEENGPAIYFGLTPDGLHLRLDWTGDCRPSDRFRPLPRGARGAPTPGPPLWAGRCSASGPPTCSAGSGGPRPAPPAVALPRLGERRGCLRRHPARRRQRCLRMLEFTIPLAEPRRPGSRRPDPLPGGPLGRLRRNRASPRPRPPAPPRCPTSPTWRCSSRWPIPTATTTGPGPTPTPATRCSPPGPTT